MNFDPAIFQTIQNDFAHATTGWLATITTLGVRIFWLLAVVDFGLVCVMSIARRDVTHIVNDLSRVLIWLTFTYMVLINGGDAMRNGVVATLQEFGAQGSGVSAGSLDPGGIMVEGFRLAGVLLGAVGRGSWLMMPFDALLVLVAAGAVALMFASVAVTLLELLIEVYVASVGGGFLIAISSTRFTYAAFSHWFNWTLGLGIRLLFTYLLLGIGESLIAQYQSYAAAHSADFTGNILYAFTVVIEVWIWLRIVKSVPAHAAAAFGGAVSVGLGDMFHGAATDAAVSVASQAPAAASAAAKSASNIGRTKDRMLLS